MTQDLILANATLVLPCETARGSLHVRDSRILSIDTGTSVPAGSTDCEGDFVAPGLIELHTDNLERHIHPRPKVDWPHKAALVAHDAELAGAGITTVFDAIRVGSIVTGPNRKYGKYARGIADDILSMRDRDALKISHLLHLRAEICSETLVAELAEFGPQDRVGIVSLMDHTPGQRQFSDLGKYRDYVAGKYGLQPDEIRRHEAFLHDLRGRLGTGHEEAAVEAARRYGAVLASHDDTTPEQVAESAAYGVRLAEFPTTVAAAQACHDRDIATIMGGPNLVRGASHSGNVAAIELARQGLLDIVSSDYVPASLLLSAVQLGQYWGDMARGLATVTSTPARATGLQDRGRLEAGLRADLIRFRLTEGVPMLRAVWGRGTRVA